MNKELSQSLMNSVEKLIVVVQRLQEHLNEIEERVQALEND